MKHVAFPSIDQFRNVVHNLNQHVTYVGKDANGESVYDNSQPKPVVNFTGTVKLHGTNASVCLNEADGMWYQSREHVITPTQDNAGFAFFAESKRGMFQSLFDQLCSQHNIDLSDGLTLTIFGEWCGSGIQRGVAVANLPKSFFIFGAKVSSPDPEFVSYWIDSSALSSPEDRIFNVEHYDKYSIDIDFNTPQLVQNALKEITDKVEAECPISKAFGIKGVGEGVVWKGQYKDNTYRFKVKGEKHSVSKVKVLASVDVEKLNSVTAFVDYVVTQNRFDQAVNVIFGSAENADITKMGDLIRWVVNDVVKEEGDTLVASGLEPKDVNRHISDRTRKMFFDMEAAA